MCLRVKRESGRRYISGKVYIVCVCVCVLHVRV